VVNSAEGIQTAIPVSFEVKPLTPLLTVDTSELTHSMLRGEQTLVTVEVTNTGGGSAENIKLLLPDAPWLKLVSPPIIEHLAAGESTLVTLNLTPAEDLPLNIYQGNLIFDVGGGTANDISVPFNFRAISEAIGTLKVDVSNELTYFTAEKPLLEGASVKVLDAFTREVVFEGETDASGIFKVESVNEGTYILEVKADKHSSFEKTIDIDAGENEVASVFLSRQTVQYTWQVVPTEIEDRYEIQLKSVFETDVPVPTVVIDPPLPNLAELNEVGETLQIDFTVTNHGLIAANNIQLNFGSHPYYQIDALTDTIDVLSAKSSYVIPVRITLLEIPDQEQVASFNRLLATPESTAQQATGAAEANAPCELFGGISWEYECGGQMIERYVPIPYAGVACNEGFGATVEGLAKAYDYLVALTTAFTNLAALIPQLSGGPRTGPGSGETIGTPPTIQVVPPVAISPAQGDCDPCLAKLKEAAFCLGIKFLGNIPPNVPVLGQIAPFVRAFDTAITAVKASAGRDLPPVPGVGDLPNQDLIPKTAKLMGDLADILDCIKDLCIVEKADDALKGKFKEAADAIGKLQPKLEGMIGDAIWGNELAKAKAQSPNQPDNQLLARGLEATEAPILSEVEQVLEQLEAVLATDSANGVYITAEERASVVALANQTGGVSEADTIKLIERWNRSIDYEARGIYRAEDVPEGESRDFISHEMLKEIAVTAQQMENKAIANGFGSTIEQLFQTAHNITNQTSGDDSGICAKVTIQIDQSAVMSRSAFEGTLTIENGNTALALEDVKVTLVIKNANGVVVNELFGITLPELEGLTGVDGNGMIAAGGKATAQWTFIPTGLAASEAPQQYQLGGTLSYTENGATVEVPMIAPPITVYPQAELTLDYFHQRDVFADDPFTTDVVEASVPFELAVLVKN
jgi:hypothetical protein